METSLPAKTELVLYAPMSDKQRELNDQLRDKTLMVSFGFYSCRRTCACVLSDLLLLARKSSGGGGMKAGVFFRIFGAEKATSGKERATSS